MESSIILESINGSPIVEWRVIDGAPAPYKVTIQRRMLQPNGDQYDDGVSDWDTVSARDVADQLQLNGPIATWLQESTRMNINAAIELAKRDPCGPAYIDNIN